MSTLFSLKDRVAIVTGASRGIGEAIALRMAEAGAAVVLAARKPEALQAVVSRIEAAGGRALAVPAHAGKPEDLEALTAAGFELRAAQHGAEALALLEGGFTPDALLMDLSMPVMSGPVQPP